VGRQSCIPGNNGVVAVAPLAWNRLFIDTLDFLAMLNHESFFTTVYREVQFVGAAALAEDGTAAGITGSIRSAIDHSAS